MAGTIIGFRGIDSSDIILYLARILHNMQYKIILFDHSPAGKMDYYIPLHNETQLIRSSIEYRGIEYTKQELTEKNIEYYDFIIINFGFLCELDTLFQYSRMVYVTDTDRAHMKMTGKLETGTAGKGNYLVIREDFKSITMNLSLYKKELMERLMIRQIYELPFTSGDRRAQRMMQYNDQFCFCSISRKTIQFLIHFVEGLFQGTMNNKNRIWMAVKNAMKGD